MTTLLLLFCWICMGDYGWTLRGQYTFASFPIGRNLLWLALLRRYIDTTALCIASSLFSILCSLLEYRWTMMLGFACVRSWRCLTITYGEEMLLLLGGCGCLGHFWRAMVVLMLWRLMLLIEAQSARRKLCSIFLFQMLRHQVRCKSCRQICLVLASSSILLLWLVCHTAVIIFRCFWLTGSANGNLITRS